MASQCAAVTTAHHAANSETVNIGVASYGVLGHTAGPFNFSRHFRAAKTLTLDSMWLPIQNVYIGLGL